MNILSKTWFIPDPIVPSLDYIAQEMVNVFKAWHGVRNIILWQQCSVGNGISRPNHHVNVPQNQMYYTFDTHWFYYKEEGKQSLQKKNTGKNDMTI